MFVDHITGLIPLFPLAGAFLWGMSAFFGDRIFGKATKKVVSFGAPLLVFGSFVIAVSYFIKLYSMPEGARVIHEVYFPWMRSALFTTNIAFWLDPLSIIMVLIITGVGFLIHLYSIGYMDEDPSFSRFFAYLNLFTSMMLLLVMGDNILLMFVGWEGVGLCSYLLISFWHKDILNAQAGMKAFIVNRVGDFAFIVGMFTMFWVIGQTGGGYSFDFKNLNEMAHILQRHTVLGMPAAEFVALMLFIGATGKSAQIPLYVWLPDAMAGPTPVSALIHAATMVTAGIFMIARLSGLFILAPHVMLLIGAIGAITSIFAASIAVTQYDIKKVLAYSTVSQLGYMFLAMGTGAFSAGVFHLMTHAFFKALLFLGSGSVILGMHHEQDMRFMGGLRHKMKVTGTTFLIGVLAIAGVFPFAGFFSKDEILYNAFLGGHSHILFYILYGVGLTTASMTAFYMFRQYFMTFTGKFHGVPHCPVHHDHPIHPVPPEEASDNDEHDESEIHMFNDLHETHGVQKLEQVHESPKVMLIPLVVLAFLSAVAGFLNLPAAMGGNAWLHHWLSPVFYGSHEEHHSYALELALAALSLCVALFSIFVSYIFYVKRKGVSTKIIHKFPNLYDLLYNKYYIDEIYQFLFLRPCVKLARWISGFDKVIIDDFVVSWASAIKLLARISGWTDKHIVDGAVNGMAHLTDAFGYAARAIQTGYLYQYLFYVIGGAIVLAIILILTH